MMAARFCLYVKVFVGLFLVVCFLWEGRRLYQKEIAKKTADLAEECSGGVWTSIKSLMRWQMSWSDPCDKEHYEALMVDAISEVNPLMVVTSTVARSIGQIFEETGASMGKSLRLFFQQIPAQWQLVFVIVIVVVVCLSPGLILALIMVLVWLFRFLSRQKVVECTHPAVEGPKAGKTKQSALNKNITDGHNYTNNTPKMLAIEDKEPAADLQVLSDRPAGVSVSQMVKRYNRLSSSESNN